jgi:hypothetical protein
VKDFRKKDKRTTFKYEWIIDQYNKIRNIISEEELPQDKLIEYLKDKYSKRKLINGKLYNNVTKDQKDMTQEDFINIMLREDVIMSGYGVLFEQQSDTVNMGALSLQYLLDTRKIYKSKKFEYEPGTDEYIYYDLLQLIYKIIANSYYGVLGLSSSIFYNSYIQNSITATGQDIITTSIVALENFMENNVPFNDADEILTFINNVISEDYSNNILDWCESKTEDEVYDYLIGHMKDPKESRVVKLTLSNLSEEDLNKIYYKNQFYEVIEQNKIKYLFEKMAGLEYGEHPSDELKPHLNKAKELLMEFVYYDYPIEDRWVRINKDQRDSVIVINYGASY